MLTPEPGLPMSKVPPGAKRCLAQPEIARIASRAKDCQTEPHRFCNGGGKARLKAWLEREPFRHLPLLIGGTGLSPVCETLSPQSGVWRPLHDWRLPP